MLEIDGAFGEGGGQVLRSAVSLAMCTGTPFRITRIRAGRSKPGLLRQHMTAVAASAEVCSAQVHGLSIGSQELEFYPGRIKAGEFRFAVGSAGSATLVLQTVLPALWQAEDESRLVLQGGTHNPAAPPFHFLQRAFAPQLAKMGVALDMQLDKHGFFPAGGGQFRATITPARELVPLHLTERGERREAWAEGLFACIPAHVAKRELAHLGNLMNWPEDWLHVRQVADEQGPGNILMATVQHEHVCEVFSKVGDRSISAEQVARQVADDTRAWLASTAAVGPQLADQLLLPMALAGEGSLTASSVTEHSRTNMAVIEKFLPVEFTVTPQEGRTLITVAR